MEFLSTKFVESYVKDNPKPLTELGEFVYYRTYSRWLNNKGRREYWHETVKRAIEYNMALHYKRMTRIGFKMDLKEMRNEAKELFVSIYETKQFPSGRTLWVGNANEKVNKDFALGNFNCSFLNISKWEDLGDLFYLLMVGTGVGFKSTKKLAKGMKKIRLNTTLLHSQYKPVAVEQRLEDTKVVKMENGFAKIYVGDSKDGWVNALREYFNLLTLKENEDIHTIKISYNSVRPKGERLKTFGGTASGHEPLKEMFEGIDKTFKNQIDPYLPAIEMDEKGYGQVRPIHIMDIGNLIGANVVVGGKLSNASNVKKHSFNSWKLCV
jgi:ribonucleoside-diphosphate reductase alpha chain/ribonucleoside-triphosphate reductase